MLLSLRPETTLSTLLSHNSKTVVSDMNPLAFIFKGQIFQKHVYLGQSSNYNMDSSLFLFHHYQLCMELWIYFVHSALAYAFVVLIEWYLNQSNKHSWLGTMLWPALMSRSFVLRVQLHAPNTLSEAAWLIVLFIPWIISELMCKSIP